MSCRCHMSPSHRPRYNRYIPLFYVNGTIMSSESVYFYVAWTDSVARLTVLPCSHQHFTSNDGFRKYCDMESMTQAPSTWYITTPSTSKVMACVTVSSAPGVSVSQTSIIGLKRTSDIRRTDVVSLTKIPFKPFKYH